jgi:SAM-dependent methyltransferase
MVVRMLRRDFSGMLYHAKRLGRIFAELTTQVFRLVIESRKKMGSRTFQWASSVEPKMETQLSKLSAAMDEFYGNVATRVAYQGMIDSEAAAQPQTEHTVCEAILCVKPSSVLEIGCGSGRIYERLKQMGLNARYTGVEISREVIASNAILFPEADWLCGDGYKPPVGANSYDCVIAYYVLEHCVYPRSFLEAMLLLVKPGGSLFLVFPDMVAAGLFPSQALGWDDRSAGLHLREGRFFHAVIRTLDSRMRLPLALRRASRRPGRFLVNLQPRCLEPKASLRPDVDAVYLASAREVEEWVISKGCSVQRLTLDEAFRNNVCMQIMKPSFT